MRKTPTRQEKTTWKKTRGRGLSGLLRSFVVGRWHGFWRVSPARRTLRLLFVFAGAYLWWLVLLGSRLGLDVMVARLPHMEPAVGGLRDVLILVLFYVLGISCQLVALAHVYLGRDLNFLGTVPLSRAQLFVFKWFEVGVIAGWMPILFGAAVLFGFGAHAQAPPLFYVGATVALLLLTAVLAAAAIAATSLLVSVFPANRARDVMVFLTLILLTALYVLARRLHPERLLNAAHVEALAKSLLPAQPRLSPAFPPAWAAEMLGALLRNAGAAALAPAVQLVAATVGVAGIGFLAFGATFPRALSNTLTARGRWLAGNGVGVRLLYRTTAWLPRGVGAVVRKDWLQFARDTTQWSQLVLLASLVLIYLLNVSQLPVEEIHIGGLDAPARVHLLALVNLVGVGFVLAAVALRFLFAAVSLEGKALWAANSAPLSGMAFLLAKVAAGMPLLWGFGALLVGGSGALLGAKLAWQVFTLGIMSLLCLALSGLGVGLGALLPNFAADTPARIVSGLGGLIFMVSALLLVVVFLGLLAFPAWVLLQGAAAPWHGYLAAGLGLVAVGLAVGVGWLPLAWGATALTQRE